MLRELAQLARALGLGPRGSGFESRVPDQIKKQAKLVPVFKLMKISTDRVSPASIAVVS